MSYIIGNHDGEFVFDSLQKYFLKIFPEEDRKKIKIVLNSNEDYIPIEGVHIKHGHEYEIAHNFLPEESIAIDDEGTAVFYSHHGALTT